MKDKSLEKNGKIINSTDNSDHSGTFQVVDNK